ncbi:hypothetical protein ACOI1C_17100 [Bacillus sp. DJP31]|uniref:hypothetical protein n=1 Tax=Bacillus sp. DJP31 TaxID=3409789 RepID=UPI003BB580E9
MASYTITKKKKFDVTGYLIMISFILFLSCIFLPFIAIYTYQDIFIKNVEAWFFGTPPLTYLLFAGALIWFSVVIIIFLVYRSKRQMEERKIQIFPFLLLLIPGVLIIPLTLNHYFYLNDEGIHFTTLTELKVRHHKWEEVVEAKQHQTIKNGVMVEGNLEFTFQNGEIFYLPITREVQLNKRRIYDALRDINVELVRVLPGES